MEAFHSNNFSEQEDCQHDTRAESHFKASNWGITGDTLCHGFVGKESTPAWWDQAASGLPSQIWLSSYSGTSWSVLLHLHCSSFPMTTTVRLLHKDESSFLSVYGSESFWKFTPHKLSWRSGTGDSFHKTLQKTPQGQERILTHGRTNDILSYLTLTPPPSASLLGVNLCM